jgi:ABC-type transport system involved in cytochrome c biogenesis permease component
MTVLPIVGRELAVASRRAGTYWLRFWMAAGALAIFFVPLLDSTTSLTEIGHGIFIFLGSVTLGFSMLAGVFLTADSLSAEKREGTLGLLFLTDLKGYDVVLGKLAANSLQAFFGLLAVFPVLALPLLTGGLTGGEFWRTILVFTVTMYFSLSIGMLVSAASQEGRQAMGGTFAAIIFLAGVLPVLWQMRPQFLRSGYLDFMLWPSPVYAYIKGFDVEYSTRFGRQAFWAGMGTIFSLASVSIVAASVLLPRSWQKGAAADPSQQRVRFELFGKARRRRRPPLGFGNPFHWLALGDHAGQSALNRMLVLLGLLWAVTLVLGSGQRNGVFLSIAMMLAFGLHFAAKVLIASESGRRFYQDRQSGALELLLVTPLRVEDIVAGQREALRKQFERAIWAISLVNVVTLAFFLAMVFSSSGGGMDGDEFFMTIEVFLGSAVMLWLDASALSWIGMWRGLKAKKYPRSVLSTWAQVMLPPWLAFFLFVCVGPTLLPGIEAGAMMFFILLWFGVGAAVDLTSIAWAREHLLTSLRTTAAERYDG